MTEFNELEQLKVENAELHEQIKNLIEYITEMEIEK